MFCDKSRLFEGEPGCVKMTCDVIRAVFFEEETGCVMMTCDVITTVLF